MNQGSLEEWTDPSANVEKMSDEPGTPCNAKNKECWGEKGAVRREGVGKSKRQRAPNGLAQHNLSNEMKKYIVLEPKE